MKRWQYLAPLILAGYLASTRPVVPQVSDPSTCPAPRVETCEVHRYTIDDSFRDGELWAMLEAMRAWERATGYRVCFVRGPGLAIHRAWNRAEAPPHYDMRWNTIAMYGSDNTIWMMPGYYGGDIDFMRVVAIHELGHALGLSHQPDAAPSCMREEVARSCTERNEVPEWDRRAWAKHRHVSCE